MGETANWPGVRPTAAKVLVELSKANDEISRLTNPCLIEESLLNLKFFWSARGESSNIHSVPHNAHGNYMHGNYMIVRSTLGTQESEIRRVGAPIRIDL